MIRRRTLIIFAAGVLLGALATGALDVAAALIVGGWLGACANQALRGRVRGSQPLRAAPAAPAQQQRADELHGLRVARERARLKDALVRQRATRSSWLRSRAEQKRREDAAYKRGVEEALSAWPRQD